MFDQETLAYIEESGQALGAARQLAEKVAAQQSAVAERAPVLIDSLVNAGLLRESEKTAAAAMLADPASSLDVTANLLQTLLEERTAHKQAAAISGNGRGTTQTKTASQRDADREGGYIGRRAGAGEHTQADRALYASLGIAVN